MNNDRGRPAGAPDTHHRSGVERSTEESRLAPRPTPLQDWLVTAYLTLDDSRVELTPAQWRAFVCILCDRVGNEAVRAVVGEAMRATGEEHEAA